MSVLPTRVGMVRLWILDLKPRRRAPHPRGDGPESALDFLDDIMCSPPAWGWSVIKRGIRYAPEVLPTRVGMVRFPKTSRTNLPRAPHPRGDGPITAKIAKLPVVCSPPAWGWSG